MPDIQRPDKGQTREMNIQLTGAILVVEDNVLNQRLIKNYLEKMGAVISIANNGKEASELALKNDSDLVYMNMQMPPNWIDSCVRNQDLMSSLPNPSCMTNSMKSPHAI